MARWFMHSSHIALVLALSPLAAWHANAADFSVPAGTTDTRSKTVGGADQGQIAAGASLSTSGTSISQNGAATGVVITNDGTINSGNRGFDTSGSSTDRTISLVNNGAIISADDSVRINTALTNGSVSVINTGTMTSNGGQVLDFSALTTSAANSANVAVNINNSGRLEALDNDALRLGGGSISVTNSGEILSTQSENRAINLNYGTSIASFTLKNEAGGVISSIDDAVRISEVPSLGSVLVENDGTISARDGQAIDFNNARAGSIVIRNTGTIETADADAIRSGNGSLVENWGTISGGASDPNGSSDGIDFQDTNSGTVINHAGTISGARHGITGKQNSSITNEAGATIIGHNGSGINFDTLPEQGPMIVTNYGTIIGTFNPDAEYGDGDGVDIDALGTIYNYGTIIGQGSKGTKGGDLAPATSEAIAIGGGTIVNGSTDHRNALISGVDNGILVDDSDTGPAFAAIDIVNYGRIEGLDGYGIRIVSNDENTIENYGTISGTNGIAVEFGAGDDLFAYHVGSRVEGYVTGGAGTDTFRLAAAGSANSFDVAQLGDDATYRDFEVFEVAQGGVWTLNGTSSFAGDTRIGSSLVALDGADLGGSAVTIADGSLSGSGTIGSLALAGSDVRLSTSGGAPAVLQVNGDVSFDANSSLVVDVNGDAGTLMSGGTVSVADGASFIVQGTSGCATRAPCTVISTQNGITGTFTIDNRLAFLDAKLDYVGLDALLSLSRNGASFASIGATMNQTNVGNALDLAGSGSTLYDEIVGFTESAALDAFDQLAGDAFASQANAVKWQELEFGDALLGRARSNLALRPQTSGALGYAETRALPEPFREDATSGAAYGTWVRGTGGRLELDGDGNAGGLKSTYAGLVGGVDAVWDRFTLGLAGGYQNSRSDVDSRDTEIEADTGRVAIYGGARFDALRITGGGSFGWSSYASEREIAFGGIDETAEGDYEGNSGSLFAEIGYTFLAGNLGIEPFAGVNWTHVSTDGFDEDGADVTGLSVGKISDSSTFTTVGLRLSQEFATADALVVPSAGLAWRHAFDNDPLNVDMRLLGTGTDFEVQGLPLGEDSLLVNAGIDIGFASGLALGLSYQGEFSDEGVSRTARGMASYRF
ncbi:autotransporter domain-containing protein [Terrihabitans sp. B22-R8]|uniref:autotransporter domain-containing protein n=1 Tax=Terrihabitans sp. B22-R8 TaxID=3425128 RepID=UPI00403D4C6C